MAVTLTRRHVLLYDYVEDVVARREPHRPAHLELLAEFKADGRILDGGAVGDPPHGALIVFASDSPADAESFASRDPYVANGIVTRWRVEPWNVVR
ncbi:MAG TPA: YciI family protein [Solirubrobacteraceae bacterium]|nr:YciI family protein [Solirubrobacteraceae bacterium]